MDTSKVFIGASDSCNFESNTWTFAFAMARDFRTGSGEYAIMRLSDYKQLLEHAQEMIANAARYKWLRDNNHIDQWWYTQASSDQCENIDVYIDTAMSQQEIKPTQPKPFICHKHG